MGSHSLHVASDRPESDWRHIEELLDELAAAAKAALPASEFYRLMLARLVPATGATGGAIWTAPRSGELRLERQMELVDIRDSRSRQQLALHQRFVENSLAAAEPRLVTATELEADAPGDAAGPGWAVFFPFRIAEQAGGVIELVARAPAPRSTAPSCCACWPPWSSWPTTFIATPNWACFASAS